MVRVITPETPYGFTTTRRRFSRGQIPRWGRYAVLRSVGNPDRPCWVVITKYNPTERQGQLANPTDRTALLAAIDPDGNVLAEPSENDRLVTFQVDQQTGKPVDPPAEDETLRIVAPAEKVAPNGLIIFWRLQVRK